ncbi:MAG TPA: CoA transferase [Candidatus Acidoferrales bacterium]|nr:CoA transferase [Candidatus Acidoferrales bacterium]
MPPEIPAPLTGTRVLDFTHVLAGPFCTRLLADLGADVVRVESSKHPDHPWPSTYISPDKRHASYLNTNRSKRSIAIDLKNAAGRELASGLAAVADVVIENFSAGVMERLKLDYPTLQNANPGLIYVSMSGYGHDGPRREWTSMNMNLQGYSGLMMVTGSETDPPTAISNSWNDYIGGLHACFGILQALDKRSTSGKGARIDLSQFECSASMIGPLLLSAAVNKTPPLRRGNRSAVCAPQGVYRCAGSDDWCAISVETDAQWKALLRAMGAEQWGSDSRFGNVAGRMRHHDEIDQRIEAWTKQFPDTEVERRLKSAGIPAERVRRINDVIEAATVFSKMEEPRIGSMLTTRLPFSFESSSLPPPRSAPGLGANTREVLREWLILSDDEISAMEKQEVLL